MPRSSPSAAKRRAAEAHQISDFSGTEGPLNGQNPVTILIRDPSTGKQRPLHVGRFAAVPGLYDHLVGCLIRYSSSADIKSFASVSTLHGYLRSGLIRFLTETGRTDFTPERLDRLTLQAMIAWLNGTEDNVARFSDNVRESYYGAVKQFADYCRTDEQLTSFIVPAHDVPPSPWSKRERTTKAVSIELHEHELRAVFIAAASAVREISRAVSSDLDLIETVKTEAGMSERRDVIMLVREHVCQGVGSWNRINRIDPKLTSRIDQLGRTSILRSARPELPDLIPFIVLFIISFRLNSGVLLSAKRTDFNIQPWIGGDRVFARPYKPRKKERHTSSSAVTSEIINPANMLVLLDRWLSPLRSRTKSDTIFQYWESNASDAVAVDTNVKRDTEGAINKALRGFVKSMAIDDGRPVNARNFTISRIRKAVLDLAHSVSKGDLLKVKAAADHASIRTTGEYYVTAAGMAREDEALAGAMRSHVTMVGTKGRFDPRRLTDDRTEACTPGWQCDRADAASFDDSRTDGQCTSYGRCPVCRHGRIDVTSPTACAQAHLLVDAIDRAIENMPPTAWLVQLAPIRMHLLNSVLPRFSVETHKRASSLQLPSLPSPE